MIISNRGCHYKSTAGFSQIFPWLYFFLPHLSTDHSIFSFTLVIHDCVCCLFSLKKNPKIPNIFLLILLMWQWGVWSGKRKWACGDVFTWWLRDLFELQDLVLSSDDGLILLHKKLHEIERVIKEISKFFKDHSLKIK